MPALNINNILKFCMIWKLFYHDAKVSSTALPKGGFKITQDACNQDLIICISSREGADSNKHTAGAAWHA